MTNCPYCEKPMRRIFDDMTREYFNQCDYHGSVRVRWMGIEGGPYTLTLVVIYKETLYRATFLHDLGTTHKFEIVKPKRYPKNSETVMTLDFHPELTPENIEKKLPTMILFS